MWQKHLARAWGLGSVPISTLVLSLPASSPALPLCLTLRADALWEGTCHISATCWAGVFLGPQEQDCEQLVHFQKQVVQLLCGTACEKSRDSRSKHLPLAHVLQS